MANEIVHGYDSAKVLYALVYRISDKYIYDVGDTAFEAIGTWNDARADECDIAMTATGDVHFGTFPVVAEGIYFVEIRDRVGANPDTDDKPVAQGIMDWDGTAEKTFSSITTDISGIETKIDTIDTNIDTLIVDQGKVLNVYNETGTTPSLEIIVE